MGSISLPGGLTAAQVILLNQAAAGITGLSTALPTGATTADSIYDLMEWFADLSTGSNSPMGVVPANNSIVSSVGALASTGIVRQGMGTVTQMYPVLASWPQAVSGGGAWTLGTYTQIVATGTLTSHALMGLFGVDGDANVHFIIEFATGAAGSEVVFHRAPWFSSATGGATGMNGCYWPPVKIPLVSGNSRLSFRVASDGTSKTMNMFALAAPVPFT